LISISFLQAVWQLLSFFKKAQPWECQPPSRVRSSHRRPLWVADGLAIILIASLALNLLGNEFPIVYHIDEIKKLDFISAWKQDFMHPLLLLQLVRIPNFLFEFDTSRSLAVLGRSIVGVVGTVLVLLVHCLLRRTYSSGVCLLVSASIAFCPTVVVHSHYIKEDILLTTCLIGSLIAIAKFVERPSPRFGVGMGIAWGLSFSTHYKSVLLVPLFLVFLLHECWVQESRRVEHRFAITLRPVVVGSIVAIAVSVLVFLIVNFPATRDWDVFVKGVSYEANHAVDGHVGFRLYPMPHWFTYHLRYNLWTGMTPVMCLWGLVGLCLVLIRWRSLSPLLRLIALFTILFYLVPEVSPTKPPPDDGRYVIPVAVGLLCCVAECLRCSSNFIGSAQRSVYFLHIFSVSWGLLDSSFLIWHMDRDTRAIAHEWVRNQLPSNASIAFSRLANHGNEQARFGRQLNVQDCRASGVDFLVLSSFNYDRYFLAANLPGQDPIVYEQAQEFQKLFQLPYKEFRPRYRSFAFSNPVIRIVQLGEHYRLPIDQVGSADRVKSP
jgi:hypothetical protein